MNIEITDVDALAQIIRRVDGSNKLGAGLLAEAILAALEPQDAPAMAGVEIPAGYTPGPWQVEEGTALVWGGGDADDQTSRGMGIPVAEAKGYEQRYWGRQIDWEERAANARLIALAPAMAEELVALRSQNDALMRERTSMIATHRGNLALAEKRHAAELANLRARVAEMEARLGEDGAEWREKAAGVASEIIQNSTPPASQEGQADAD